MLCSYESLWFFDSFDCSYEFFPSKFDIFPNEPAASDKNVHNFWYHYLAQYFMPINMANPVVNLQNHFLIWTWDELNFL